MFYFSVFSIKQAYRISVFYSNTMSSSKLIYMTNLASIKKQ